MASFSLAGKSLKLDTAEDLDAHIKPLIENDDVEEVVFQGNTLGIGACKRLGEVLATKKKLKSADLSDIYTGRLLSEIPDALSSLLTQITNLPNLTTVNLSDNAFGLNTVAPIVKFLSAHVPLQHLYLNNNGLGPSAGIKVADALSQLHTKKAAARKEGKDVPELETIICGRNRLESGSMEAWAKMLSLNNNLKTIKMIQNGIRPEGLGHFISQGLSHARGLEILDLQDNTFTFTGAKELSKIIPTLTKLQELGVSDTLLSNKGGRALFRALGQGKNPNLETLRLQYGEIKAPTIKQLLDVSKGHLPALKRVELNGNKFSEEIDSITNLRELLEERQQTHGKPEDREDAWGMDSLSDLETDSEEEESEEEEEEAEAAEERKEILKEEVAEAKGEIPIVSTKPDSAVDKLAEGLKVAL